ncbi:MAG: protein translocase subunit SecD [Lachnospiraceae bacterium]|nr:protein translocase subunit SecD [Lachnospiraceae bacterium]
MKKSTAAILLVIILAVMGALAYPTYLIVRDTLNTPGEGNSIKLGLDLAGGVSIKYQATGDKEPSSEDMADTIYKLQQRVDQYSTEALVYQEGNDRINIEIPGVSDANEILEELGKPGSLYFIKETGSDGQPNYSFNGMGYDLERTIEELEEDGSIVCSGTDVISAEAGSINENGQREYVVNLTFNDQGTKAFADATTEAFNNGESIGIYYDDAFVSVPRVNEPITGGQCQISGQSDYDEAKILASTIRIGGLKVELEELSSSVVGAQLGSKAIQTSFVAAGIGILAIFVFMIAVYWIQGVAASLALIVYTEIIVCLLNGFSITLTLPGIAGIILSIGMAVDANVIIFARIREEIAEGKTVDASMKQGYSKALSAIIDGNITTLIAAAILGIRGTGTVKGFAVTLALGIIVSLFTALLITRLIMNVFYGIGVKNEKFYGRAKVRKAVDITGKRVIFFVISIVLVLSGPAFMIRNSSSIGHILNFSQEFLGGTSSTVDLKKNYTVEQLENEVVPVVEKITGDSNVNTSNVAGTTQVVIKTRTLSLSEREEFETAMEENFEVAPEDIQMETISSTISSEMQRDAILASIIALLCMLVYIWFRFKDVRFGAASVIALLHDALVVVACYAFTQISVGGTFIACVLTIIGYSINATIVIFDRIRENLRVMSKSSLEEVVNTSISQTLSRSVFTSLTTFITVFVLYLLGVSSIRDFALPLMVGVICGTYSSVFLAGNLWYIFRKFMGKKAEEPVNAENNSADNANKKNSKKKKK